MECFEKGFLTKEDTGGIDLRFGNAEAMLQAIELIARRQGIGNLLAEGTARMARQIGHQSRDFAIQVKGLEAAYHEPRISPSLMLSHMVIPTGADHCMVVPDGMLANEAIIKQFHPLGILAPLPIDDASYYKVGIMKIGHCTKMIEDSLVMCTFVPCSLEMKAALIKAVTGWDTGVVELLRIGERILTLMRLFNLREGLTSEDDILPERFYQPKTDGALANIHVDREKYVKMKQFYYALMGWDAQGVPLQEKIEELNIIGKY
jgi:aldehyde:ferredoxin oxidoreductase